MATSPSGSFQDQLGCLSHIRLRGKMGVGVIIRDAEGLVVASLCSTVPSITDPPTAEAIAAWKAAELCHALGLQRVILEGDALAIVQGLRQEAPSWCQYGLLLEDTRSILNSLPFWKVTHVRREANGAAHGLAQAALHQSLDCIWYNSCPDFIQSLVLAEQASSIF
jgi:ribonuclease HI